ncbi:MAG: hypothetical protein JWR02_2138, partial [Mucilaginibacter sp.]|nr:hypothetical protein [Mucilaginibacter sp.]
ISNLPIDNIHDDELRSRLDACLNWQDGIGVLMYLVTHYIQKKIKQQGDLDNSCIDQLYNLQEVGLFTIETIDRDFIQYMLNYSRSLINEDLSDTLLIILQNYIDHSYDSSFCF